MTNSQKHLTLASRWGRPGQNASLQTDLNRPRGAGGRPHAAGDSQNRVVGPLFLAQARSRGSWERRVHVAPADADVGCAMTEPSAGSTESLLLQPAQITPEKETKSAIGSRAPATLLEYSARRGATSARPPACPPAPRPLCGRGSLSHRLLSEKDEARISVEFLERPVSTLKEPLALVAAGSCCGALSLGKAHALRRSQQHDSIPVTRHCRGPYEFPRTAAVRDGRALRHRYSRLGIISRHVPPHRAPKHKGAGTGRSAENTPRGITEEAVSTLRFGMTTAAIFISTSCKLEAWDG
ncbi:hypothetical protein AAFF_G00406160 [Aldrovandia affinis]|uniref:Uncharacterized protein n=1 Tax=Aldrovandia affinis TaxID=143900 RepID=A0AAD7SC29_9TELE|nr:hypothetical protein AAFF_G00406160 [Aldrovandia affinis]